MPKLEPEEIEDESDEDLDEIPAKASQKRTEKSPAVEEPEIADGEEDDDGEDEYAVEKIVTHDFSENGAPLYQVKWLGYEAASDLTWEPEENLAGAEDILQAYFEKIGGRPKDEAPKSKGRKRKSNAAADSPADTKKAKTTNGKLKWEPPKGSWEDSIQTIQTIQEDPHKVGGKVQVRLQVYLVFNDGHKYAASLAVVRTKCPQKLLDYFENHLTFKEPGSKS